MNLEELKEQKDETYCQLRAITKKLKFITQMKVDLEAKSSLLRNAYAKLDRQLAEQDGRVVKLKPDGRIEQNCQVKKEKDFFAKIKELPLADRLLLANALKDLNEGLLQ